MIDTVDMPIDQLHPYHLNPRRGNVELIAQSLRENGQYRALVVNVGTHTGRPYEVLAGNHTLIAAAELGWETVTVGLVDVDDQQAAKIVAVDNRSNDVATYDDAELVELLESIESLDGTGYTPADLDDLKLLLDDTRWDDEFGDDDHGEPDDENFWPKINLQVPPEVFDAWRVALDRFTGDDDVAKLRQLLTDLDAFT